MLCQPWLTEHDLAGCDCDLARPGPARIAELIDAASGLLYLASGSRYSGACTTVLRPCHATRTDAGHPWPALVNGVWLNLGGCGCGNYDSCTCGRSHAILLPYDHPTAATVRIDGAVFTDHRLHGRLLYRSDGLPWPCCQDLGKADTEVGTWSVTLTHGLAPSQAGIEAARALTVEFIRACNGEACRLPVGTQTVIRQGLSLNLGLLPGEVMALGIWEVDLFLGIENPHGLRRRGRFYSPDVPATLG